MGQLCGMLRGPHALLAPSKVSLSTLHLLLRLLQAVAASAPAAGVDLGVSRDAFTAAVSQGSAGSQQHQAMEVDGGGQQPALLDELLEVRDCKTSSWHHNNNLAVVHLVDMTMCICLSCCPVCVRMQQVEISLVIDSDDS